MTKKVLDQAKLQADLEEFDMRMIRLKSIFSLDLKLIEDDRNDEEHGMPKDDSRRNEVTLKLNPISIHFTISPKMQTELKKFFKEKGWEFVGITSTPSIKLRKIQEEEVCAKR